MGEWRMPTTARIATATARQKPDFSGEWKLNLQASTLSRSSGLLRRECLLAVLDLQQTTLGDGKFCRLEFGVWSLNYTQRSRVEQSMC